MKKKLIIIAGPTASGKTAISIELAKRLNGEIISADSMQVYRYMNVGTAKITKDQMQGISHHLIDILDPKEDFNIVEFQSLVKTAIEDITQREHMPIMVGGTGFYIQSVLYDIDFNKEADNAVLRSELEAEYDIKGSDYMYERLKAADPVSAENIHRNNKKRIIRAIEYFILNNAPISQHNEEQHRKASPYDFRFFVLYPKRDVLYERINKRVDIMVENGLVAEVEALKKRGLTKANISMQGIGYKEMLEYLDNKISLNEAVALIKQNTRHLAKRQVTWFKREKNVIRIDPAECDDLMKTVEYMMERIKNE